MTMTSVVLGIAMLGGPKPPLDCDCAADAAGSTAVSCVSCIGLSFRFKSGVVQS